MNGPTWENNEGTALSFDGTNDYVDTGFQQQFDAAGDFSYFTWIKTTDTTRSILMADLIAAGIPSINLELLTSRLRVYLYDGTNVKDYRQTTGAVQVDNKWHHVGLTYSGADQDLRLWSDGKELTGITKSTDGTLAGYLHNDTYSVLIGRDQRASTHYYSGLIDGVDIYSRALSPQEIAQLWNGGIRGAAYEMDGLASPFVTQWGSVAAAEAAAFQAAWGANATTVAGIASGF